MLTIHSDTHHLHHGAGELYRGRITPCFETPERADIIARRVAEVGLGDIRAPASFGLDVLARVHAPDFLAFLQTAWSEWTAEGNTGDAMAGIWPARDLRRDRAPIHIDGKLGFYSFDGGAPIMAGTWEAVRQSANVALTGADLIDAGARSAFALCRPPGHHAGARAMGGYCYLNNAAIAAQYLRDKGAGRVAILDVDYHHGNGSQSIFYDRADVLFVSIHADPDVEYPFFLGHADEHGEGAGLGFNVNYPLPWGAAGGAYAETLSLACDRIGAFGPDALVVSLGVDTFDGDPISHFKLRGGDFLNMGRRIAAIGAPTLFVMEGGYAVADIGVNAVNVLSGFQDETGG